MNAREKILNDVLKNQPPATELPGITGYGGGSTNGIAEYMEVFKLIGGSAYVVDDVASIRELIHSNFDTSKRVVTTLPELSDTFELISSSVDPHSFDDVELAIIRASLFVAENGAVWIPDELMGQRIIPYICQHLGVIVTAESVVPTLHEAYDKIGSGDYGFGAFIGGLSKTADIEQALVLGAHGPLSMTVFILK